MFGADIESAFFISTDSPTSPHWKAPPGIYGYAIVIRKRMLDFVLIE